jgi:putative ABC transport system permease protein
VTRVVLRGLLARRLRLGLTAFAVALGVTLVAGTYVFTDTINASFDTIFTKAYEKTDVVVSPGDAVNGQDDNKAPMPASVLDKVRSTDGIANAEGGIFDFGATVLTTKGKKIGQGGIVASRRDNRRYELFDVADGRLPGASGEVAIDRSTAKRKHLKLGDQIVIAAQTPKQAFRIVGIIRIQGVDSLGGSPVAMLTLPEAQRITGKVDQLDEIDATVTKGTDPQTVKRELAAKLGPTVHVRTGSEEAASQSKDIRDNLGFLQTALLAFAGISLFVGAFIIFNTFSITVAQRAREFGLLRTLGASRAQVLRSVLGEGLVLGFVGAALGIALGIGLAAGLRALFKAIGFELPSNGTVIASRTIIVSIVVGVVVTMLATLAPAIRATRVPPVAALREGFVASTGHRSRFAFPASIVMLLGGIVLMALGLFGAAGSSSGDLTFVGVGAGLMFLGTALVSPRLVPPIAGLIGAPMRGITGRLARENAMRQPGRTAATAAALMVGVALVAFASIFAASARKTIHDFVSNGSHAQFIVQNTDGFSSFSPLAAKHVAQVQGVDKVSPIRFFQGEVGKDKVGVTSVDPATFPDLYRGGGTDQLRDLRPGAVYVSKGYRDDHHPGAVLNVKSPTGQTVPLHVAGTYEDKGHLLSDMTIANTQAAQDFAAGKDNYVFIAATGGKTTQDAIKAALKNDFPQTEALTNQEFIDDQAGQIDQVLALIYALLALAIIVSLFGIVNTLVLSITERTRELGMLRAIGTSRRQVRRMIRYEAIITAMLGGILGAGLGLVLALLVSQPLDDFKLAIPFGSLIVLLVLSGIAGVFAAVLPARRAAKLDVLEALAYE